MIVEAWADGHKRRMWFKPENTQPASTVPFLPRAWALNGDWVFTLSTRQTRGWIQISESDLSLTIHRR